uniref:E3 ubiquitin-protein ligase PRT1 n=1 Tax=Chenopodium quinoa TaxID=63459 RepID=A0A803LAL9_CHEQI
MSFLNCFSSVMANNSSNCLELDHHEETISDSFICCVCLDLLYKPIVLECGHVSCFWCVHKSMDMVHESHCPICRNPYHYFPNICEMLHFLLLKMYPLAYKRRGKQILEEETARNCFSPQLDCEEDNSTDGSKPSQDANAMSDPASSSCITRVGENSSKMYSNGSDDIKEKDLSAINKEKVSSCDVLCPACKELLYRPAVLNCGHGSNSKASAKKSFITPFRGSEDFIPWWNEHGSKVHAGAGCDYCGMCPIVGNRYRCLDCVELMGFDLCGNCYNTRSKRPGRFNQQHTLDHKFELVKQPDNLQNLMVRLVGGHLIDSSGAPVLAISAIEDPPDGWIAVESVDDLVNPGNNVAAADESPGDMHDDTDTQDGSIEVEFVDALEVSEDNAASLSHLDHNIDQDGNKDPPF